LVEDESQKINTLNQIYAAKKWPNSNKFSDFSNYHFSKMITTHHLWLKNTQLLLEPTKSIQLNNALSFYLNIVIQKTSLFTKMFALNSLKSISKVSFLKNVENTEALKNLPNFEDFYRLALEGEFLALKELIEHFSKKEIAEEMENPFKFNFSNMFLRPFFLPKTTINWLYKIYLIDYLAHPDCESEDCSSTYKKTH